MKKKLLFAGVAFMTLSAIQAQDGVGIGKSLVPDASAVLDIGATDKGVLIPRLALTGETDATTIKGAAPSLLVFNTANAGGLKPGYYFWLDNKWNALVSKTSTTTEEVLTKLELGMDVNDQVILNYTDEEKKVKPVAISIELQNNQKFKDWIGTLVSAKSAGVEIKGEKGVFVADPVNVGTEAAPKLKFTISAVPGEIPLTGDVTGNAGATSVDKIKGIDVVKPGVADNGQALVYDDTAKTWKAGKPIVEIKDITNKADLTGTGAIKATGGTGAVLATTSLEIVSKGIKSSMIDDAAVTTDQLGALAVTKEKIKGGNEGQVLVSGGGNTATWVDQTAIVPLAHDVKTDESIEVTGGTKAVLASTELKVKSLGIKEGHLADNAVTAVKIAAKAVTLDKLAPAADGKSDLVLTTGAAGVPQWVAKNTIATKEDLKTDGIITITESTSPNKDLLAGAVMVPATLNIKDLGITNAKVAPNTLTVDKLATVAANKNMRLTTNEAGTPGWESKFTTVTTAAAPVPTNDVIDGLRVYTVKVGNGTVVEPGGALGYNSIMNAIPVTNIEYLLSAQIFDANNKLLVSSVTDVTVIKNTSVQFRFGVNTMYSTLPVGNQYKVVLRYVSNVVVAP